MLSSLGVKDIKNLDGSALAADHIKQDSYYHIFYQGTYFALSPLFSNVQTNLTSDTLSLDTKKIYAITSGAGDNHYFLGKLRSGTQADGYANIVIHRAVDQGETTNTRTEVNMSQRHGTVSTSCRVYGNLVSGNNLSIKIYQDGDDLDVYLFCDDYALGGLEISHVAGSGWVTSQSASSTPTGTEIYNSNDSIQQTFTESGSVGIGTTSPSAGLHIVNNATIGEDIAIFEAENTKNGYVYINGDEDRRKAIVFQSVGVDKFSMGVSDSDEINPVRFYIASGKSGGNSSLLNIKDDGDISIGTTLTPADLANTTTVGGFATGANGLSAISRSTGPALYLNRLSTHGDILVFRYEGATVGQVTSVAADSIAIGSGDTGLRFEDTGKRVQPFDVNSGLNSDGLIDLGYTNKQFKDVYISGSVYKDSEDIQTLPQNTKNQAYTFTLSDIGKSVYHSNSTAYTWTIPPNSTTAFPIGTAITLINDASANVNITIARGSGVTLILGGDGTNQNCTLARYGVATIIKVGTNKWYCSGNGVS